MRLTALCNGPKWTISASGGLGLLPMVSELDTGWCASKDAGPPREVDTGWCASKDAGPQRRWIVRSHISWRRERNIPYNDVEMSP